MIEAHVRYDDAARGFEAYAVKKWNMGGLGTAMMKGIMQKKKVPSLEELIVKARTSGIKLVACSMSMDIMGIRKEELIDGVELGGVAMYLDHAEAGAKISMGVDRSAVPASITGGRLLSDMG